MGVVTAYRKRHWTGLDADLASVPNPQLGDTYLATDKNKLYYKTAAGWKTGLGYEYVPRAKAAPHDWDQTDFTLNSAWHVDGLNASAIAPVGTVAIAFIGQIRDDVVGNYFSVRKNATEIIPAFMMKALVSGVYSDMYYVVVPCDADRLLDYYATTGTDLISLSVTGWFI